MTAKWIQTNGKVTPVRPVNGTDFQLVELMHYVGGYFTTIRTDSKHGALLVVNEDARGLKFNPVATQIFEQTKQSGHIAGNALLCLPDQIK